MKKRRGLFFAIIVLLGNSFLPLITNTKPAGFSLLYFSWMTALWEVICVIPIWFLEKRKTKTQNVILQKKKEVLSCVVSLPVQTPSVKLSGEFNTSKTAVIWKLLIVGVVFTLACIGTVYGLADAGSIAGSIALKTSPIYAMIIGVFYLKEKINIWQVLITFGLFAVLIYMGTAGTFQFEQFSWGIGVLMLVPLCWGIGHGLSKPLLMAKVVTSPDIIIVRNILVGLIIGIIYVVLYGWAEFVLWTSPIHLFYMFLIGINNMLMHWAWYQSIKDLDLSLSSALVIPSPVLTIILALMITQESLYYYHIVGLVGSMVGLYLLLAVQPKKKK